MNRPFIIYYTQARVPGTSSYYIVIHTYTNHTFIQYMGAYVTLETQDYIVCCYNYMYNKLTFLSLSIVVS